MGEDGRIIAYNAPPTPTMLKRPAVFVPVADADDEHVIGAWTELSRLGRLADDPLLVGRAELELAERDSERREQHLRQGAAALEQRSAGRESAEAAYRRLLWPH